MALFLDALDEPAENRAGWLDRACKDEAMRDSVDKLLNAHGRADAFIDHPVLVPNVIEEISPRVRGQQIGPWQIEERIGEGGMGVVYRASRADGLYQRTVAMKLLAPGAMLASGDHLARRLAAERQILARLEHDGIARLYDGGVTEDGLPYLALELIDGEPITAYATRHNLSPNQRVRLFTLAVDAVAYAHRSLVVHRDIKPAHILVVEGKPGDEPSVKLLDFGVSELLDAADEPEPTSRTVLGALTPAYAAPEQIRGEPVTTLADVYALGVVLYELLAGQRPYDLAGKTATEVERLIVEIEPPSPSSVVETALSRTLRGDLDTIIMKAISKEPERRYASADALAGDLRRYLRRLPILARPATIRYRAGRFVRRNRVAAAAATAATVLLIAIVVAFTVRLSAERDLARDEAATALAVTDFLRGTFAQASPSVGPAVRTSELSLADALRQGLQGADTAFTDRPVVRAALLQTLGQTFLDLGLHDDAAAPLREAMRLRDSLHARSPSPDQVETADALALLAMWRHDLGAADTLHARALKLRQQVYGLRSEQAAVGMANLAENLIEEDHYDRALALLRDARAIIAEGPGEQSESGGEVLFIYAVGSFRAGRLADADAAFADLHAFAQYLVAQGAVSDDDDRIATILIWYGQTRLLLGHPDEAAPLFTDALARRAARYDQGHPYLSEAQQMAAMSLLDADRIPEAEQLLRTALPGLAGGDPYPENLPLAHIELARALAAQGRPIDVDALQTDLEAIRRELGPNHGWTRYAARRIAELRRGDTATR